jgi:hypothetical protein
VLGDADFLGNLTVTHADGYRQHSASQYEQFWQPTTNGAVGFVPLQAQNAYTTEIGTIPASTFNAEINDPPGHRVWRQGGRPPVT